MKTKVQKLTAHTKVQQGPGLSIIAIGASAGGMNAIHTLFDHTPTDAVSYVIIQHLSPDYKSFMAELLAKHSKLKVYKAEHEMEVVSNCVYVMPEGKTMTIADGRLVLKDRQKSTPNSAIDIFFNSLAEDQGDKCIGIVLSGNGSDGTKGIAAIKKVGGMVIVQDPESTEYDSMPRNAIESGCYDYVLTPKQIPQQIIDYIAQRALTVNYAGPISEKDEAALVEIISLIKKHTPLDFSDYKRPTIVRRITRRMIAKDASTTTDYIRILQSDPAEIEILAKEFLISVTNFFRDPEAFETVREKVIPAIVENKLLTDTLKVWVIGCATGEEAFSLAILIKEHLIEIKKDMEVKIFASDIDKDALAKASKGHYPESISADVSEERLRNFFIKEGKGYRVRDTVRKMIIFADHDIVQQPPYGRIDLITCRNLLIYFNPPLQKKIFSTIHFCLNIGGYLFLGPSEGIGDLKNMFREVDKKWKIYENIEATHKIGFSPFTTQHKEIKQNHYPSHALRSSKADLPENLSVIINQSHLEESGYMGGICIDEHHNVIQSFGSFEKFLVPKFFNNNLLELLPAELAIAVGTSIKKAIRDDKSVAVQGVKYKAHDAVRAVKILVKPVPQEKTSHQKAILVYFGEEETAKGTEDAVEVFDKELHTSQYLSDVEQELSETKAKLQKAYYALDEMNDNLQAYNEELLSGNEEMQSSNEELQSTNEELNTVNNEYQSKIKELAELNDDFDNYFRSTVNSQVYVDKKLNIRKFTPIAIKQINIKESDVGRPLADISTNIRFSSLIGDIKNVIATKTGSEKQIETKDGRWYSMMILPYVRSGGSKVDGAIITFNDITDLKIANEKIVIANSKLVKINEDHDTFIYSVSHDLKSPLSNMEGLLSVLKDLKDTIEIEKVNDMLHQSVVRLKDTIGELSAITNMENETEEETVNLGELLEDVKWSLRDRLLLSEAKLTTDLKETEIKFSKKYLRSILLNLLSNAIKYRSHDRALEVVIASRKKDGSLVLSVQDNGTGISKENVGQLFSKFKRVHALEDKVEGTGIGLYLVKKIVTNSGGEIEVESKRGEGSCFKVYFKN